MTIRLTCNTEGCGYIWQSDLPVILKDAVIFFLYSEIVQLQKLKFAQQDEGMMGTVDFLKLGVHESHNGCLLWDVKPKAICFIFAHQTSILE